MKSVWISGAGSGIGLGLAHEMVLNRMYCATLVDKDGSSLDRALQGDLRDKNGDLIQGYQVDVTDIDAQRRAFAAHVSTFGSLDVAILNAGIGETDDFVGGEDWKKCLDVNLVAVMEGIRIAVQNMQRVQTAGEFQTIMVVASAGALWAMPFSPVYAASKAGVVMLVKSLAPRLWKKNRIRLVAVCPQFVDTPLVARYAATLRSTVKSMLTVPQVSRIMADIIGEDSSTIAPGDVMSLMTDGEHTVYRVSPKVTLSPYSHVPRQARKIIVDKMSHDFRKATRIVSFELNKVPKPGHVLVKNSYCGVNASDVNFSAGKYHGNKPPLPMDAGFEATGIVVAASPDVADHVRVGQAVAFLQYGGFSEYKEVHFKHCFKVQKSTPEVIALLTSGLTASIALEQAARIQPDDTVLITAAAGGTGQFFVQLAKRAGAQVIATCGSEEKGKLLSKLGADVIINYKVENVKDVLTKRFPKGVSLVIELVGGDMFDTALKSLCPNGRLVIIGAMSQYGSGWQPSALRGVPERLLAKNQSLIGFFLLNYAKLFQKHFNMLYNLWRDSKLHVALDPKAFHGIDSVFDAVEWLQNGDSQGKVTKFTSGNKKGFPWVRVMGDDTHANIPEPSSSKDFSFDQHDVAQGEDSPKIISPARPRLETPTLVPVSDRHVLVTPAPGGSRSESIYELMRDWVHGPETLVVALANREKQQQQQKGSCGLQPPRVRTPGASSTIDQKPLTCHMDDGVMANQTEPNLESHLRRWKALGKRRREEFQHRKALGFEKLGRRMQI